MIDNKFELSSPLNTHLKESDIKRQPKVLTGKVPRPQQQLSRLLDGASAVPSSAKQNQDIMDVQSSAIKRDDEKETTKTPQPKKSSSRLLVRHGSLRNPQGNFKDRFFDQAINEIEPWKEEDGDEDDFDDGFDEKPLNDMYSEPSSPVK